MAFRKGYHAELELISLLRRDGFYAVRIPVSGGRTFPCDILAVRGEARRAYQVKETKQKRFYMAEEESKRFLEVCQGLDFKPILAVKWKRKRENPWTLLEVTEAKSLKIDRP